MSIQSNTGIDHAERVHIPGPQTHSQEQRELGELPQIAQLLDPVSVPRGVPKEVIDRECRVMKYSEALAEEKERFLRKEDISDVTTATEVGCDCYSDATYSEKDDDERIDKPPQDPTTDSTETDHTLRCCRLQEAAKGDAQSTTKCFCGTSNSTRDEDCDSVASVADDHMCEVCQCGYEDENEVMVLPCNHFYHLPCIQRWLGIKTTCPKCRYAVTPLSRLPNCGKIVRY